VNVVDENNAEKLSSQSRRPSMGEPAIKSVGDAASENILDGKGKGHGKPEMEAVMVDIIDVVMFNTEYEADIIDAAMLNTEYEAEIKVHQGREFNMYEKPETRDVMDDITDAVMLKHGVRGWRQGPLRQGVQRVQEA
jgi:hypothetical protein